VLPGSLVGSVVDDLAEAESSVVVSQLGLVERLWLVVTQAVMSANLISVRVGLSTPKSAIPVLTVS